VRENTQKLKDPGFAPQPGQPFLKKQRKMALPTQAEISPVSMALIRMQRFDLGHAKGDHL
jgi:hypothetical protein